MIISHIHMQGLSSFVRIADHVKYTQWFQPPPPPPPTKQKIRSYQFNALKTIPQLLSPNNRLDWLGLRNYWTKLGAWFHATEEELFRKGKVKGHAGMITHEDGTVVCGPNCFNPKLIIVRRGGLKESWNTRCLFTCLSGDSGPMSTKTKVPHLIWWV